MKEATELAPLLTLYQTAPGVYLVRITEKRWRELVVKISRELPDPKTVVVVTPTDVKAVVVRDGELPLEEPEPEAKPKKLRKPGRWAREPEEPTEEELEQIDQETAAEFDALEKAQAEAEAEAQLPLPVPVPDEVPVPAEAASEPVPTRRRKPYTSAAGHDSPCRRCGGSGQIQVILEGGQGDLAPCSICSGTGMIRRYGER